MSVAKNLRARTLGTYLDPAGSAHLTAPGGLTAIHHDVVVDTERVVDIWREAKAVGSFWEKGVFGKSCKWYGSDGSYKCPATLPVRCKARKGTPVVFA